MTTPTYNPGEPVFEHETGDLLIDPATGDAVIVAPGKVFSMPGTDRTYDADDVGNAAYYRVNTFTGEVKTDQGAGVDYPNFVFSAEVGIDVAVAEIVAEGIKKTPGVQAVSRVDFSEYSPAQRVLQVAFTILKENGEQIRGAANVSG